MVSMPLSYGSSLTRFGRRGAMKRDRNRGMTGKTTATTRKRATGPKVLSTLLQFLTTQHTHRGADSCGGARSLGTSIAEGRVLSSERGRPARAGGQVALRGSHVWAHRAALRPDEH